MKEADVIAQVKNAVRATGLKLQRINTGGFVLGSGKTRRFVRTACAGTLDFEGYDNHGRFCAIECKRPKEKGRRGGVLSAAQKERIEDIRKKGGVAIVATSGSDALRQLGANGCF